MKSRQIVRPWLEGILITGEVPGVRWIDKEKLKFMIPWPRGGNDGDDNKRKIYEMYATQTGKYRPGIDEKNYNLWKSRLRCALNKAKDIIHIKEESKPEDPNPFQVYMFLDNKSESEVSCHEINFDQKILNCTNTQENTQQASLNGSQPAPLPDDLESIDTENLIPVCDTFDESILHISDKMDSIQMGSVDQCGFDVFIGVCYCGVLDFQEKLCHGSLGFFVGSNTPANAQGFQEIKIDGLGEEFFPGILLTLEKNAIFCTSCIDSPLLWSVKGKGNQPDILKNVRVKLLKNQDCPNQQVREVLIKKDGGMFSITVFTVAKPDAEENTEHFVEEITFMELQRSDVNALQCMDIPTFDDFSMLEQSSLGFIESFPSSIQTSLND